MSKLMLDFLNAGLLKTMTIITLNMMPKHPKAMTNTPLTTRLNNSVEGDILYFSIFSVPACKVSKQNIRTQSLGDLNKNHNCNHLLFSSQDEFEILFIIDDSFLFEFK